MASVVIRLLESQVGFLWHRPTQGAHLAMKWLPLAFSLTHHVFHKMTSLFHFLKVFAIAQEPIAACMTFP